MTYAAIPSPSSGTIDLGPLSIHAYGLFIGIGVLGAVWLAGLLWSHHGGDKDDVTTIALWGVPAGIVGARLYHVCTDFELYRNDPFGVFAVWDGGLGIWGGVAAGTAAGLLVARRRNLGALILLDIAGPALALAQAIGRWGNYFNQELFGRPTELPWAIEISPENRPSSALLQSGFHPTFLYESLWCLALCLLLLAVRKRFSLAPGNLFALYVAGYTAVRFFVEGLRVDLAPELVGLRLNQWTSILCFVVAVTVFVVRQRKPGASVASSGVDSGQSNTA